METKTETQPIDAGRLKELYPIYLETQIAQLQLERQAEQVSRLRQAFEAQFNELLRQFAVTKEEWQFDLKTGTMSRVEQ